MEYSIAIVGLAAVVAAWDGFKRYLAATVDHSAMRTELSELQQRVGMLTSEQLVNRNHMAELKNFLSSQRKGR